MTFNISEQTTLGKVVLKVENLDKMTDFYVNVIGLDIINKSDLEVDLAIDADKKVLLTLRLLDRPSSKKNSSWLISYCFLTA